MNEYLEIFQSLSTDSDRVLEDQYISGEIKQSTATLRQSVQPCISEITQFAAKLKQSIQPCVDEVSYAEEVWNSKARILAIPSSAIWEQLGELTGQSIRFRELLQQYQQETCQAVEQSLNRKIDKLKKTWFDWSESERKFKRSSISFFSKNEFIDLAQTQLLEEVNSLNANVPQLLKPITQTIRSFYFNQIFQNCMAALDIRLREKFKDKIEKLLADLETQFGRITNAPPSEWYKDTDFVSTLFSPGTALIEKSLFGISLKDFDEASKQTVSKILLLINAMFEERIQLADRALETAIAFYTEFLEKQARYREEPPKQRQVEKAIINLQRQQLLKVQQGIEAILSNQNTQDKTL